MNIREYILHLTPGGTNAFVGDSLDKDKDKIILDAYRQTCPNWPPDLFAVVASIVERSGCYTLASPDRHRLSDHVLRLKDVQEMARSWNEDPGAVPTQLAALWETMWSTHGDTELSDVCSLPALVAILLTMFAVADETCSGMGWDVDEKSALQCPFASYTMGCMSDPVEAAKLLRHLPTSFCVMVPPDLAVVLPKSLTASVGCTVRSLSHFLALLPPSTIVQPSWIWSTTERASADRSNPQLPYDVRLLLVPFPYTVDADCFELSSKRQAFGISHSLPAYFKLNQRWLQLADGPITGKRLAEELLIPLIRQAYYHSGAMPDGIVLPECALTTDLAKQLVEALEENHVHIEFLITGVLDTDPETGATYNRAQTFVLRKDEGAVKREHNKHHRWRLDASQVERYALDFDNDDDNSQWWEDIDVGNRQLSFFGLRKDMSITTLICEDLARADPAINIIRAVGPNLVIALLMDGPQLGTRWPGRYATVLADDPGSAVLSFTCSAMVDRSNWLESRPARSIGLWRDAGGRTQEIALLHGSLGVLLTLESVKKRQTTLDGRSDNEVARQLKLRNMVPLFLVKQPDWI
ncbi:hypothetical protein [Rugamonas sp. DEMB1]|uniref:hypothetical protein n=1 Tax=Rugamonas sp. DEMB1 TaxID=3039386 RepID=UPI00244BCB8A|nr:hypothetical protein [Rugamonas sp. DEMB1]WGG48801.1 hypothetical protein QC826_19400 [Rugamonas sp. DEMB1]